jgi:F420-dependent oxidoreductase-like protein
VQAVTDNRLILGIGLSHQVMVEGIWGMSYEKPARYMKEYLASLMPLLRGETVSSTGERVTTTTPLPLDVPGATTPPVLVAALGTVMLKLAGTVADGTVTWMTGTATIGNHIVPTIRDAAAAAGRPEPRVGVSLPVAVTNDVDAAKERINQEMSIYPSLPSYKAMLDNEGAQNAGDIAFVGDEETVAAAIGRLKDAGATDFVGAIIGDAAERERSFALLSELARS